MGLTTPAEIRLSRLLEQEKLIREKWSHLTDAVEAREDKTMLDVEEAEVVKYREQLQAVRAETEQLTEDIEADRVAEQRSLAIRHKLAGMENQVEQDGDGIIYRDFASYARDVILSRDTAECSKIAKQLGDNDAVLKARERLQLLKQRTPANTLSSNVGGLIPPDHISQIFQVIDNSRPLVSAAASTSLVRGTMTYPQITTRPIVNVQVTEKTEAGNQGMVVDMVTIVADTYLGGGDLSWQALNWSTPDALQLWFNLAAADYALKTERAASKVVTHDAYNHVISDVATMGSSDFATLMKAIGEGYAKVYAQSNRIADTLLLAPDFFGYLLGLTSTPQPIFVSVNGQNVGPLNLLVSRGLDSGTAIVGDMEGLLTAETPGAPVELRVVEPAIGGLEVGLIGAFKPAVVDLGSFALISASS